MPITWKKKFKPDLILKKIADVRNVSADGTVSFLGSDVHEIMPILNSMLDFPPVADRVNKSTLIWKGITRAKGDLNKASFEAAINLALKAEISTRINPYALISSLSISPKELPRSIKVFDTTIEFLGKGIPRNFINHYDIVKSHRLPVPDTPKDYLYVRIMVRDNAPTAAAQQAIDHLDLLRGLIALYVNFAMQWGFRSSPSFEPINLVRCGSRHTIHTLKGQTATETIWFEPSFRPAKLFEPKDPVSLFRRLRYDLQEIGRSSYKKELSEALIRYARAFDDPDQNNAFLKLWSVLESLTTPGVADYDRLVHRCSFLYTDSEYHKQVLEHLRHYRNRSVHSGVESSDARTNCFLLQQYFRTAFHFYKGNRKAFSSLADANDFLDLPADREILTAKLESLKKAIKFRNPHDGSN